MSTRKPLFIILAVLLCLAVPSGFAVSQEEETPPVESADVPAVEIPAEEEPTVPEVGEDAAPQSEDQAQESEEAPVKKTAKSKKATAAQSVAGAQTMSTGDDDDLIPDQDQSLQSTPVPDAYVFTGAAGYKIPIAVPPGRNGLAPSLALTYNSYRANSWVGTGWDLDLGSIRRSTKRGLDYEADDFVFESAGSVEELISATSFWGENYYRAKIEEGFTKYFKNGANGWVATAKDGAKYYYGQSASSRQGKDADNIYKWCLDKIEDPNGNYLEITYFNDQGELYPHEIKYTGHSAGLLPKNSVKFILEDRADTRTSFTTEAKVVLAKRLKAIETYADNALARKYELGYVYGVPTIRSLVSGVTQYGSDGVTPLPATLFQYQDGGEAGTFGDPIIQNGVSVSGMADVNGDGLTDLVSYGATNNETQSDTLSFSYHPSLGNGQFGPLVSKTTDLGSIFYYKAETKEVCGENANGATVCHNVPTGNIDPAYALRTTMGDINGDGELDIIVHGMLDYNSHRVAICLGKGDGDFNTPIIISGISAPTEIADINGDGLGDWVSHSAANNENQNDKFSFSYRLSLGNGQFGPIVSKTIDLGSIFYYKAETKEVCQENPSGAMVCHDVPTGKVDPGYALRTFIGDINGDGKLDVVIHGMLDYNSHRAVIFLGKGTGEFDTPIITNGISAPSEIADINGDGLGDLVSYGTSNKMRPYANDQSGFSYRLSLGNGQFGPLVSKTKILSNDTSYNFSSPNPFYGECSKPSNPCENNENPAYNLQTQIGDVNGDGKPDIVIHGMVDYNTPRVVTLLALGPAPDLLASVQNGYGGSSLLAYAPSSIYQNGLLPFVMQTVASVTQSDGISSPTTSSYTYQGGAYDFSEREFRGFAWTKKTFPDNTTEETWFHQDKHFQGRAYQTESRDPDGTLMGKTVLTWNFEVLSSGVTFVKLSQKHSESYDAETVFNQEDHTYDNTNGNLLSTVASGSGALAVTLEYQYQDCGNWTWRKTVETLKNELGVTLRKTTDDWQLVTGNLLSSTSWLENGESPMTRYEYDAYGKAVRIFDAMGNPPTEITYETGAYTFPEYIHNPLGHTIKYVVDPRYGLATQKIDVGNNNNTINYSYDPFGRLILTQNPDNGGKEIIYSDVSDVNAFPRYILAKVKESATDYVWAYGYFDGFGRSIQTTGVGEGDQYIITRTYYDEMGRVNLTEGPFFAAGFSYPQEHPAAYPYLATEYDYRNRSVAIKSPHGDYPGEYITTSFSYSGFSATMTDPDGNRKTEKKDYLGRIIEVTEYPHDNEEYHITYEYNAAGDLLKVTDALNNQTTLVYDTLGRKREMTDPDMGHWTYEYDKNGNLKKQTDAKGQAIKFTYDTLNRMLTKGYYDLNDQPLPNNSPVANTYDNLDPAANGMGKPYTSTKGNVVLTSNLYDSMGRILKVTKTIDATAYVTQTEYDLSGKVTKLVYPNNLDATEVRNEYYPGTNLLKQVIVNNVITALYTDYEPTAKIGQIDYQNGTATKYTYDAWSQKLFGIVTTGPSGNLQDRSYTYSRAGDILRIQDDVKGITYDYAYDKLHRLVAENLSGTGVPAATTAETITLNYEGTGPVHAPMTIDLNGVPRACSYDANGNMVVSPDFTNGTNPLDRAIAYDGDNMPVQIAHANGATVNFVYDSVAKRTKKLVQGGKTVLYLGAHYEVENNVAIKYIFAGNLRLAQIKGSLTSYFHKDHLGSTAAVTDASGNKVESTTYEPFGATRDHTGDNTSAYKFTDQELDNETNLYNYEARLYDPVIGMFVTPDSIVPDLFDPQSLNRYAYCRNNPLIYTDPTGHVHAVDAHGDYISHDGVNITDKATGKATNEKDIDSKEKGCVTVGDLINQNKKQNQQLLTAAEDAAKPQTPPVDTGLTPQVEKKLTKLEQDYHPQNNNPFKDVNWDKAHKAGKKSGKTTAIITGGGAAVIGLCVGPFDIAVIVEAAVLGYGSGYMSGSIGSVIDQMSGE